MEYAVLGWPPDGPTLRLDYERFSYAGKFVMSSTGKAVVRDPAAGTVGEYDDHVLAAVAFNEDRTDADALWLRYVTVRADRRGEGIGPRLCAFVTERAHDRGYERVRIAVNNLFAFEALYRAGFGYTGETTGLAELVLEHPTARDSDTYQRGLDAFRERDLSVAESEFLEARVGQEPPAVVETPSD